ncbi:hypothetical protein CROQUDRAFT_90557 [Cronartium quercuum f. sp. fusiforme G11]|uniref:Uncharacterized protein n=1 Tax=Cronartium quercuum f. sp. fusiforme G11 TaxID=708437 RepID=A0A9P6TDZ8_9BASI|nr:hypothetical protein CROQUDRAFT_90557 [Cronartium quercuum f. sp. fusiforme G11]
MTDTPLKNVMIHNTPTASHCVETHIELVGLLNNPEFGKVDHIQIVGVMLEKMDLLSALKMLLDLMQETQKMV